jgi:AraC-like DNA-binding protein
MEAASADRRESPSAPQKAVAGIDIDWLFQGPIVQVNRWTCQERTTGVTRERQQHWRVVGFVHAGAYELRSPRGRTLIDPLNVAFLNPGEPYQTSHPCGCGDHGTSLIFRDDVIREIVADRAPDAAESPEGPFVAPSGPCSVRAALLERALIRTLGADEPIDPVAIEERALAILQEVTVSSFAPRSRARASVSSARHRDLAEHARWVLGTHFRHAVGLADLAKAVGTSPFHLCRILREHSGLPVHRYLTLLRMHAALESLEGGERDLTRLAFDLGYSSHSHFTFVFRKEWGVPPSEFRKATPGPLRARSR